jgi:anti-sigma factor RsiW
MRFFPVACRAADQKMADLFTGELHARERLELEAHADVCARCGAALRDLATISVALDRAYAPLRQRGTLLSPARVRLAIRAEPRAPTGPWWRAGFVGRLSEATLALGFAALVLGGSLDLAVKPGATVSTRSVIRDYVRAQPPVGDTTSLRWLRSRAIRGDTAPAVRSPAGDQFDVPQADSEEYWLSTGAPR